MEDVLDTLTGEEGKFQQSWNDDAVYTRGDQRGVGAEVCQWVDDFIGGAHEDIIDEIIAIFRKRWPTCTVMKDWRNLLGNVVTVDVPRGIASVSLRPSIEKLVKATFGSVEPPKTTLPYTSRIASLKPESEPDITSPDHAEWLARQKRVRCIVGKLVHISQWDPSIVYATSKEAGIMAAPSEEAEEEVRTTVAYLHHRKHVEIQFGGEDIESLDSSEPIDGAYRDGIALPAGPFAFADGALGDSDESGKSLSGIVVMVGRVCVIAISARQHCVAKDSHDTEIYAASLAATLMTSVRDQLQEKGWLQLHPANIFIDSASSLHVVESVNRLHRSLHLARRVFLMRMAEHEGEAKFAQTPGNINKSDPMTKAVPRATFLAARDFWFGKYMVAAA